MSTRADQTAAASQGLSDSSAVQGQSSARVFKVPRDRLLLAGTAMAAWIALFAAGLLIETLPHRYLLSPLSVGKQLTTEDLGEVKKNIGADPPLVGYSFFVSLACYTPSNLAILALMAGLIGGCASNISISTMPDAERARLQTEFPHRTMYLQEPPASAAGRGFIVYLCVIAGLYVAMDDPFKNPTSGQYIRLAGLVSLMAFAVGYDPSRLEDWLRVIPGPGPKPTPEPQLAPPPELPPTNGARQKQKRVRIPETVEQAKKKAEDNDDG